MTGPLLAINASCTQWHT